MDLLDHYLQRSQEIIGDRTREEIRYDKEVLRWLRKGKKIQKAIERANKKYPKEALEVDKKTINDVAAHYDHILEHENIMKKMN